MTKINVFMIMPFEDEFFHIYEKLKEEFDSFCIFNNAKDAGNQQNILRDIFQPLLLADLVIADLTGLNANVMYELGVAHSFNKDTIVITKDEIIKLPFDLKQYRALNYDTTFHEFDKFLNNMRELISAFQKRELLFGNPISDFINTDEFNIEKNKIYNIVPEDKFASDLGFLDFNVLLVEYLESLTINIKSIAKDMNTMSKNISESTTYINKAKNSGGCYIAKNMKKEYTKVSFYIDNFNKKLTKNNELNYNYWAEIEKNIEGLLNNDFSYSPGNKRWLISFLTTLFELPKIIDISNNSIKKMQYSMNTNKGIEQSLTRAIEKANKQLDKYINITVGMADFIEEKRKKLTLLVE
jgi:hypothetical protein